jgi:hypothetical protein
MRMPSASASAGRSMLTGCPSSRTSPLSGLSAPESTRISVDLPAPFSPTSASTRPGATANEMSRMAGLPSKLFLMRLTVSSGIRRVRRRSRGAAASSPWSFH